MMADDAFLWTFTGPIGDDCQVKCKECKEFSPLAEWAEGYVDCEDCGDHAAMVCPRCGHGHDHVYSEPMEILP